MKWGADTHKDEFANEYDEHDTSHVQVKEMEDDKKWMKHTLTWQTAQKTEDMTVKITYRPVIDQPMDDEMHHVPPAKRVY